ncbi:MAG: lytic transglycosylase domain-containing protein [Deltaproteobacteria bacterium]|nr:lytic transglycosylase domain-containing protein [Deltaproteobacteria bacterium]
MKFKFVLLITPVFLFTLLVFFPQPVRSEKSRDNPWEKLQDAFPAEKEKIDAKEEYDPWKALRRVYLPFTEREEEEAAKNIQKAKPFSKKLLNLLKPYQGLINECSQKFNVPEEIIGAVILVESGGNKKAAAKTSSARGLMQTIRSTFKAARSTLKGKGIDIEDDPYNPRSSIYAGTWYLKHIYKKAQKDNPGKLISRSDIENWCTPAKYYYAGPADGSKREDIIIKYIGGKKLVVDKQTYCNKVMRYAKFLKNVVS